MRESKKVCVFACAREGEREREYVCVCRDGVCVMKKERERKIERGRERFKFWSCYKIQPVRLVVY